MDGFQTHGLELVKGVLSHAAAAGKNKDHVVATSSVHASMQNLSQDVRRTA